MGPTAALLSQGGRLHLQHGPIDLIIGAEGERNAAFAAAKHRFDTVLDEIVAELPLLRAPVQPYMRPAKGPIPRMMQKAVTGFGDVEFVTAMAAVAGSVAEAVLSAMVKEAELDRAYVNNGGDIAIHLTKGQRFKMAMAAHDGSTLGQIEIGYHDPIRGIATSGRHGRSLSLGIADSVIVLAETASIADVSATLIANAVDLPNAPAIQRKPARECDENSDLGDLLVVTGCGTLSKDETQTALSNGQAVAQEFVNQRKIHSACLFLKDQSTMLGKGQIEVTQGTPEYA